MNFFQLLHGNIMGVSPGEEVKTVEFSRDSVPEAGGCQCVERVHLVLEAVFIIVNLFKVVYDFNIALY